MARARSSSTSTSRPRRVFNSLSRYRVTGAKARTLATWALIVAALGFVLWVILAVAGMEGALPSVVAGLVARPVIAVPTSVGYGASFNGLAALLGMLNSCASNVSVVNIDNGFGAGYVASLINRP